MIKKYLDKKLSLVKNTFNWDTVLDVCIPVYLFAYGYIFYKSGLWEGLELSIRKGELLTEKWFLVFIGYLFLVLLSRCITDIGVNMWRRDNE